MQYVFVLDREKHPLMPCHPARARKLLAQKKAALFRRYPFTIILKDRVGGETQPIQAKIDPGSQTTGVALVVKGQRKQRVIWGADITHWQYPVFMNTKVVSEIALQRPLD